jgi:LmbE family N-acetylglucosaminyl deacetylase
MQHDPSGGTVILSPHLDDAVLSAWSALSSEREAVVVNVCTGVPPDGTLGPFDAVFGASDSAELMRRRLAEDAAAMALTGCTAHNLGFLEDQYREAPLEAGAVGDALTAAAPRGAALWAPAGIGGHPDHHVVRTVALELARSGDVPLRLYADLPYAVRAGWPHWVTGDDPRPHLVPEARWQTDLASLALPDEALTPCPVRLRPAEVDRKLRALRSYETQFEVLNAGPLGRLTTPHIIGYELSWEVTLDGS